ncbi:MAG: hypothetical protein IKP60_10225 [Treponema sp.]|nr:hypothetical protein [Treponema sp.]
MKKILALVLVAVSVLGMAVAEEPEWVGAPKVYGMRVYEDLKPNEGDKSEYIYFYAQNREFANGRSTAKKFAEKSFADHFRSKIYGLASSGAVAIDIAMEKSESVDDETEESNESDENEADLPDLNFNVDDYNLSEKDLQDFQVMATKFQEKVENVKFSDYELLEWYYEETKVKNKKGFTCFVLGRVPKKAVSDMLCAQEKKAEKSFEKEVGHPMSNALREAMDDLRDIIADNSEKELLKDDD